MFRILNLSLLFFSGLAAFGQNPSAFRQFYVNPYVFNAAYCGNSGFTEFELLHRQQWVNFKNAPKTSGFNFQYPTKQRLSIGLNFFTEEAVALRNSFLMTSIAYRIVISPDQFFSMGMSLGGGFNNLELNDVDYSNDPTILEAAGNSWYADGNFGLLYSLHDLKIGFALTNLFGHPYYRSQLYHNSFSQLINQLYSVGYRVKLGKQIDIEPVFLYRLREDRQHSWEIATVFHFQDKVALGTSYHATQGLALLFGLTLKEQLSVSYSYEFPPLNNDYGTVSSHEFHLSVRIGKQRQKAAEKSATPISFQTNPPVTNAPLEGRTPVMLNDSIESQVEIFDVARDSVFIPDSTRKAKEGVGIPLRPPFQEILSRGHYVVVGVFQNKENASRLRAQMRVKGYEDVHLGKHLKTALHYVYVYSSYDLEDVKRVSKRYIDHADFSGAWIVTIE